MRFISLKTCALRHKIEKDTMEKISYALVIRSIMHVVIHTRLDVFYALSIRSRYQSNSGESHLKIVKNILKYLERTKNVVLVYDGDELIVYG